MTSIHEVFAGLGIPNEIKQAYVNLGIQNLYSWQAECLYSTNVLRGDNLVYCAPTSGGKTFIAELVLLKNVINRRKRVIFVLPYVSLVLEKYKYFQKILKGLNATLPQKIKVKAFCGDQSKLSRKFHEDIIICTIEKANMICNEYLKRKWMQSLGCVIFDETHVLGNSFNGYLLEIFISKLMFFNQRASDSYGPSHDASKIQLVALSATMGNVQQLAHWLHARLYVTTFRPVPLQEHIRSGDRILSTKGEVIETVDERTKEDPDGIGALCSQGVLKGQQVLIFCPTKASCIETAIMLSQCCGNICHRDHIQQSSAYRMDLIQNKILAVPNNPYQESARAALANGYAYHHAGLDSDTREWIEAAFLLGHVSVLCATSTLAAGVNLPAGRVIIRSLYIGRDLLSVTNYKQMVGRAGRAGQSSTGESFIVVKPSETDRAVALVNQPMPDIKSQMNPYIDNGSALLKALVEVIGLEMCHKLGDIFAYISTTLWAHQLDAGEGDGCETKDRTIKEVVQTFIKFLFDTKILVKREASLPLATSMHIEQLGSLNELDQEVEATKFGKGILGSNFSVDEAIIIYQALYKAQEGLALDNYLHLLYLITPLDHNFMPNFSRLLMLYDKSKRATNNSLATIFDAIGGHVGYLSKWQVQPPSKQDIQQCQQVVKISGIEECLQELKAKLMDEGKPSNKLKKSTYTSNEWHLLCICKRFWAAMVLQHILDGVSTERLCKEYQCEVQDIEDIQRKSRMMGSKVQAFCKQLGWFTFYKLTKDFKHSLDVDVPKDIKKLLLVPGMTLKVAKVLSDRRMSCAEDLVKTPIETVVLWLQLSLGFELQDIREIELVFQSSTNVDDTSDSSNMESGKENTAAQGLPASDTNPSALNPLNAKTTRDGMVQAHLTGLVKKLIESARALVAEGNSSASVDDGTELAVGNPKLSNQSDSSSESSVGTSDSEEEEYDEEVDPYMDLEDDELSVVTSMPPFHDKKDEVDIESALGSRKLAEVAVNRSAVKCLQDLDCRSPLAKQARRLYDDATPAPHDQDIQALTSSVRKMKITPLHKGHEAFHVYISDEELLRQVEDWEANGMLYQTPEEQLRDEDILRALEESEDTLNLIYIPLSPAVGKEQTGIHSLLQESLKVAIEGVSDKQALYTTLEAASRSALVIQSIATTVNSSESFVQIAEDAMVAEEVADDVLFKAMEEWETTQTHASSTGEIVTISQEVSQLARGLTSSNISPDQAVTKVNGKMFSPYITPFTPSKIMSAGKYLYLPTTDNHVDFMGDTVSSNDISSLSILDSLEKRNIDAVLSNVKVTPLTDLCTIQHFLSDLKSSNMLSFELVFKPLPRHLLHGYTLPSKLKDGLQSWSSYISAVVSPIFNITSNISDFSLADALQPFNANNREALQGNYVLTGISFYAGGIDRKEKSARAFYLPLPCLLPIPKFSMSAQHIPSSLDKLPMKCKQLIICYCGFDALILKTKGVYDYYKPSSGIASFGSQCSNPLFAVSRNWCLVARYTAVLCWRLGVIGLEWRFLQEVFGNPSILKISAHIKPKMAALREREVTMFGSIYDPSVAHELLNAAAQEKSTVYVPSLNKYLYAGLSDRQRSLNLASSRCINTAYCLSSVIKALNEHKLWDIYQKIEMPLISCVTDMEVHGIEIDTKSLSTLRKDLVERKKVIESYFSSIYGKDFSLESGSDTKKVRDLVMKQYRQLFESTYGGGNARPVSTAGRSDWSIGKASCNAAQQMDSQIAMQAKEHILWQLMSEYHSHAKILPNLSSVLSNRRFQRVRPIYSTIGTETGRVIANQPPIQQYPKLSKYIASFRPTLQQELGGFSNVPIASASILAYNQSLRHKAQQSINDHFVKFSNDSFLEAAVKCSYRTPPPMSTGGSTLGKLVFVLPYTIKDPHPMDIQPDVDLHLLFQSQARTAVCYSNRPYNESWVVAGGNIEEVQHEWSQLAVVDLAFDDKQLLRVVVPASLLRRVAAPSLAQPAEQKLVQNCLSPEYFRSSLTTNLAEYVFTDHGKTVSCRQWVQASSSHVFLAADYCQIELRLLAHFIGQGNLIDALHQEDDIFYNISAAWYHKNRSDVSPDERQVTKQICYAIIYGAGCRHIAEELNILVDEAEKMYHSFLQAFPEILMFVDKVKEQCAELGYVETLLGRRRKLKLIHSKEPSIRAKAERQAVNTLCQGSAADLIKLAMINIHTRLEAWSKTKQDCSFRSLVSHPGGGLYKALDDVRLVLQVHDELIYELREEHFDEVAEIVRDCMEQAVSLCIPLKVKISKGRSWGELKQIDLLEQSSAHDVHGVGSVDNEFTVQKVSSHASSSVVKNLFGSE